MYPLVKVQSSEQDVWLNRLLSVITSLECSEFFLNHLGKFQTEQKTIVKGFQERLFGLLDSEIPELEWHMEYAPSEHQKDSIDIYGECKDFVVALELDKNRADQVAKKFVSRVALMPSKKIYFISLCYPGTEKMNLNECLKYFGYCSNLTQRMSGLYAGLVTE
ncbi:MAG: hypothetical protein OIF55_15760 [Amphritea sp.]|nr:hypothetical protein [Amphritea sp.]